MSTQSRRSLRSLNTGDKDMGYGSVLPIIPGDEKFEAVDWAHGADKERQFQTHNLQSFAPRHSSKFFAFMHSMWLASQAWFVLALVGALTSVLSGSLQISKEWMFDLRRGMCVSADKGFWYSRNECCADAVDYRTCLGWRTWGQVLHAEDVFIRSVLDRFFFTVLSVIMAFLSAHFVTELCPSARGSGIPELKTTLGGFISRSSLSLRMLIVKSISLLLAVGSGLSLGLESVFVHLACCIASQCSSLFSKYRGSDIRLRELLSGAAAAGISTAFGAPIGGVLFSFEMLSSYFPPKTLWRSFFCAIVASIVLRFIDPMHTGQLTIFEVSYHTRWNWFEVGPFLALGITGGVIGSLQLKLIVWYGQLRRRTQFVHFPRLETALISLLTAVVCYGFPYSKEDSTTLIAGLYADCEHSGVRAVKDLCEEGKVPDIVFELTVVAIIKFFATFAAVNLQVPGGHFVPTMAMGACIGRIFGTAMSLIHVRYGDGGFFSECEGITPCITPGVYAIIGSAAVLTGLTRATLSIVVIMFEITGGLEYIPPTMTAVVVSKWVSDAFGKTSLYDELIHLYNYPHLDNKLDVVFHETAADVMDSGELCVIPLNGNTVSSLKQLLAATKYSGFPVVVSTESMIMEGYITRASLSSVIEQAVHQFNVPDNAVCVFTEGTPAPRGVACVDFSTWVDSAPITMTEITPLNRVIDVFMALRLRYILITRHGRLQGVISKRRILRRIQLLRRRAYVKTEVTE